MRRPTYLFLLGMLASELLSGQLTMDQKAADFQYLAGLFAKNYGPYEWKRDVLGFDLLDAGPWLTKITATRNDLDFFDVMSEYVSGLNDAHAGYSLPSRFAVRLNFTVDLYDGALYVDSINRSRLPGSEFPFLVGYELVSIDGVDAQRILSRFTRYSIAANTRSTRRLAAELITARFQSLIPSAPEVPEISTVVFRRPDGALDPYRIPWTRSGLPLTSVGKYPAPPAREAFAQVEEPADYTKLLRQLQNCRIPDRGVLNFGSRTPIFVSALPNFTRRLGGVAADVFYSGVMEWGGYKIGFIRIPDFSPLNSTGAVTNFQREIAFFEANTDGLVVDVMRNPGGSVTYTEALLGYILPYTWTTIGFQLRATSQWVARISSALESAKAQQAPAEIIDQLQVIKDAIVSANREMRGLTTPVPLGGTTLEQEPRRSQDGALLAYTKPVMLLADELTASGGDMFTAVFQDSGRGPVLGWRTMGAGGNVSSYNGGSFSLGVTTLTQSLMVRSRDVVSSDFPVTRHIENVGVRPDIEVDYMTWGNLISNGLEFTGTFLEAMIQHIQSSR
ncbi:MAG TPA: S41 family peptidase [Bryobacteraceae bacterium]|nr:S41 family peptidase [Bryobacteraceae bacterium]